MADGSACKFRAEENRHILFSFKRGAKSRELFRHFLRQLAFARGQPANCGGFLAGGELDGLRRLASQLDLAGIQQEKLRTVMPDARANLPSQPADSDSSDRCRSAAPLCDW